MIICQTFGEIIKGVALELDAALVSASICPCMESVSVLGRSAHSIYCRR
jgi:hypothetical protein